MADEEKATDETTDSAGDDTGDDAGDDTGDRTRNAPDERRAGDGQDYVDRDSIDFDPDDGLLSGTALDGDSDIPGPHAGSDGTPTEDSDGLVNDDDSDDASADADEPAETPTDTSTDTSADTSDDPDRPLPHPH